MPRSDEGRPRRKQTIATPEDDLAAGSDQQKQQQGEQDEPSASDSGKGDERLPDPDREGPTPDSERERHS